MPFAYQDRGGAEGGRGATDQARVDTDDAQDMAAGRGEAYHRRTLSSGGPATRGRSVESDASPDELELVPVYEVA